MSFVLRLGLIFASGVVLSRMWPSGWPGPEVQWGHDSVHRHSEVVVGSCFRVRKPGLHQLP